MADQVLFGGFKRLRDFALDPTSRVKSLILLEDYIAKSPIAYVGQPIVVYADGENNGLYIIVGSDDDRSSWKSLKLAGMDAVEELFGKLKVIYGDERFGSDDFTGALSLVKINNKINRKEEEIYNNIYGDLTDEERKEISFKILLDKISEILGNSDDPESLSLTQLNTKIDDAVKDIYGVEELPEDKKDRLTLKDINDRIDSFMGENGEGLDLSDLTKHKKLVEDILEINNEKPAEENIIELFKNILSSDKYSNLTKDSNALKDLSNKIEELENAIDLLDDGDDANESYKNLQRSIAGLEELVEKALKDITGIQEDLDNAQSDYYESWFESALESKLSDNTEFSNLSSSVGTLAASVGTKNQQDKNENSVFERLYDLESLLGMGQGSGDEGGGTTPDPDDPQKPPSIIERIENLENKDVIKKFDFSSSTVVEPGKNYEGSHIFNLEEKCQVSEITIKITKTCENDPPDLVLVTNNSGFEPKIIIDHSELCFMEKYTITYEINFDYDPSLNTLMFNHIENTIEHAEGEISFKCTILS